MATHRGDGRGIVTPEAVLLDFSTAGLGSRVVARLLDTLVLVATLFATGLVVSLLSVGDGLGWLGVTLFVLLVFGLLFGYPVALETLWRGRTVGKLAMGLRVVTVEGGPVRFRHAAIRAGLGIVDIYLTGGFAAAVSMVVSPRHQRLGDLAAGTIVIRERTALGGGPTDVRWFPPPAGYEAFTAALDPTGLRPVDHVFARSVLLRVPGLRPAGRIAALEAAERVITARASVLRPPRMPVETFVQAVVSAYQTRRPTAGPRPLASVAGPPPSTDEGGAAAVEGGPAAPIRSDDRPSADGGFAPLE